MKNVKPRQDMIRKVKILSGILGFFYCGGMVWYGDIFLARPLPVVLLLGSTGVALIITPLLSDAVLRLYYFIRLLSILLLLVGIGGSLYSIVELMKSTGYWWDMGVVMLQYIVIISVLIILGIRIIRIGSSFK